MSLLAAASNLQPLTFHSRIAAAALSLLFIVFILELIRRHKLQERYTVLWLATGIVMLVVTASPGLLGLPASLLGVRTPWIAWIALVFLGILFIVMHLTVTVSRQSEQITRLSQELGLEREQRQRHQASLPKDCSER